MYIMVVITTIILVNIYYFLYLQFLLVMKTFKIYSLSNFQIYKTVMLTMGFPGGASGKVTSLQMQET